MLEFAGGQDRPEGGKEKKDKRPKGDKWGGGNPEDKAVFKPAEKAAKGSETERDKWIKELNKAYPGRVSPGQSPADFEQWFDLLSGGERVWERGRAPIKQVAELFDRAAGRLDLGNVGELRRDEFMRYADRFLRPGDSPAWKPDDPLAEADKVFRRLDRDGSGFLEPAEWPDRLRALAARYDADRDDRISRDEYRAYFEGRGVTVIETGPAQPVPVVRQSSAPAGGTPPVEPFVGPIRYGHLPPGLPAWFVELDADKDGQIALYEWRQAGRSLNDFLVMDLNGDGLLPPDEYLRYLRYFRTTEPGQ
jgi:hypothetical protein